MPAYDRYTGDVDETLALAVSGTLDLTGGTATVQIKKPDGVLLSKAAVLDAAARTVSYVWIAGDLDQGGRWRAWGKVTIGALVAHADPVDVLVGWVR